MIGYKFGSDHEYHTWCADIVSKIYYAGICMKKGFVLLMKSRSKIHSRNLEICSNVGSI